MAEYILDIECRSMQDNLEFMEMPEHTDPHVVPTYANQMEINQSQQEENPDQSQSSQQSTAQATFARVLASSQSVGIFVKLFWKSMMRVAEFRMIELTVWTIKCLARFEP